MFAEDLESGNAGPINAYGAAMADPIIGDNIIQRTGGSYIQNYTPDQMRQLLQAFDNNGIDILRDISYPYPGMISYANKFLDNPFVSMINKLRQSGFDIEYSLEGQPLSEMGLIMNVRDRSGAGIVITDSNGQIVYSRDPLTEEQKEQRRQEGARLLLNMFANMSQVSEEAMKVILTEIIDTGDYTNMYINEHRMSGEDFAAVATTLRQDDIVTIERLNSAGERIYHEGRVQRNRFL